jgi:ribosomal protein L11 methyltransferase
LKSLPKHDWRELALLVRPGYVDSIGAFLNECGFSGLVEEADPDGESLLRATYDLTRFPGAAARFRMLLDAMEKASGECPARVVGETPIPEEDWETRWREGLGPVEAGRRLVVRPSWSAYENRESRLEIIIDPRMAFGSGNHATTVLCLEALEAFDLAGKRVLDAGSGSGVLAIAALRLGAREARGVDIDEWSVANARDNAAVNGVAEKAVFDLADLAAWEPGPGDVVLANLISGLTEPNLPKLRALLVPGGTIVFSGILCEEEPRFLDAVTGAGFTVGTVSRRGDWIAVVATVRGR